MSESDYSFIDGEIGLLKAVSLLVGTALGMSIFVVPTQMLAQAGPSIILAVLISIIPMVFASLMLLQLGGAVPVAGGVYIYASRLVGPFWGMISVIIMPLLTVWAYLLFAAIGFAQYLPILVNLLPFSLNIPIVVGALALLVFFTVLNYFGIRIVANAQLLLVAVLLIGILTFTIGGFMNFDSGNLDPLFPDGEGEPFESGYAPFLLAVVLLYIPFQGFSMIIELGEEMENPERNVPLALVIGMSLVTVLVLGLITALIGSVPWEQAINPETGEPVEGGLAAVMMDTLPGWSIGLIAVGALVAAATTVNSMITSFSRTLMAAARDGILPKKISEIHEKHDTPTKAILLIGIPPILAAPFHQVFNNWLTVQLLDWLVVIVVSGIFISFIITAVALWKLPTKYPEMYQNSRHKIPEPALKIIAAANITISLIFMGMVARTAPSALVFLLATTIVGAAIYEIQTRRNQTKQEIQQKMQNLQ